MRVVLSGLVVSMRDKKEPCQWLDRLHQNGLAESKQFKFSSCLSLTLSGFVFYWESERETVTRGQILHIDTPLSLSLSLLLAVTFCFSLFRQSFALREKF